MTKKLLFFLLVSLPWAYSGPLRILDFDEWFEENYESLPASEIELVIDFTERARQNLALADENFEIAKAYRCWRATDNYKKFKRATAKPPITSSTPRLELTPRKKD